MKKVCDSRSLPKTGFLRAKYYGRSRHKKSEFQDMLDAYLAEAEEDLEPYSVNLPADLSFWDDGYRDVRWVGKDLNPLRNLRPS
jgi:hypothetical protein